MKPYVVDYVFHNINTVVKNVEEENIIELGDIVVAQDKDDGIETLYKVYTIHLSLVKSENNIDIFKAEVFLKLITSKAIKYNQLNDLKVIKV